MKKSFLFVFATCFLMIACEKKVPMSVSMNAELLEINGKTACVVHKDTANIVFLRDSVMDEKADSFTLRTTLTLLLDSVFPTDQMDADLMLSLVSPEGMELATLYPVDSLLKDSLIQFLQKQPGEKMSIDFKGLVGRSQLIQMAEGVKACLKGFSFLYADPTATKLLNEYRKALDGMINLAREAKQNTSRDAFSAFVYAMAFPQLIDQIEKKIDNKLLGMKDKMSPLQLECYEMYHRELKTYEYQGRR